MEIHHRAIVNLLLSMQREPGFTSADSLLAVTTLSFDISELELYLPLISGGRLVIAKSEDARDPNRLSELLRKSKCTVLQATPAAWRGLVESGWTGEKNLRAFCGGEALGRDLADRILPRVAELWNLYGPTETTVWSTAHRVAPGSGSVSIGRPIDNTEVHILDSHQNLVPVGTAGELHIGGAGVARGYLRREELTAERFVRNPFQAGTNLYRTGDLARRLSDGTLECMGRIDSQVKIRGFRIEPGEIEAALLDHEDVRAAAVRIWPDASGNFSIAAYIAGAPKDDLRRFLQQTLPDYMIPARFVTLDQLPLTPNGKVDRNALPEPSTIDKTDRYLAPQSETERQLATIWEGVLDTRPIGADDNFFDLGGHSFLIAKLLRKIEVEFGTRLSMAAVFHAPTVARLAALIEAKPPSSLMPHTINLQPLGTREPLFWLHAGQYFRPLAESLGTNRPFIGVDCERGEVEDFSKYTFSQFATKLLHTVRAAQPHGPYHLGGWCVDGLLAYEVASQLIAMGEKVSLVVLLDAINPTEYRTVPKYRLLASKIQFHLKQLTRTQLRDIFRIGKDRLRGFATQLFNREEENADPFVTAISNAAAVYDPKPIAARVLALQPAERPTTWDLHQSWKQIMKFSVKGGGFEVRNVPGDHLTLLQEPNVAKLAACINSKLRDNVVEIRRVANG